MQNRENAEAVGRMCGYIEQNLRNRITLTTLARQAGYSPYYCARIFKEHTGRTPFEYIRARRLSLAALRLLEDDTRVLDVALEFVFDSHEGFTRAFSAQFGLPPQSYAKTRPKLNLFMPDRPIIQKGEITMETANTIFVQVVDRPARKLILKRGKTATEYFAYCEEVGCDVWETLVGIKDSLHEPMGVWLPDTFRPNGTSLYAHAVEVAADYSQPLPKGFEIIDLPPCKLLIFQGQPYDDEKYGDAIGALCEATKNYNPAVYGYQWDDEAAPRFQLAPMGYRGYIEGRPVRPL